MTAPKPRAPRPRRAFVRAGLAGLGAMLLAVAAPAVHAEEVTIPYNGLTLNADHVVPPEADALGPTVLIVHGTLAHRDMETIETIQAVLADRAINSLAINLSLGIDNRHGSFDCTQPHRHKHSNAVAEIDAWVAWLKGQGVQAVTLLGHSRGGNQVAWYAAEHDDPAVTGVVLVAPALWNPEGFAEQYQARTGMSLAAVLDKARSMEPDDLMTLDHFLYCEDARVAAGTVLDYYGDDARRNTPSLLSDIAEPTVIVIGTADDVVPGLLGSLQGLEGDSMSIKVVQGATHYFRDLFAEDIGDAVEEAMGR